MLTASLTAGSILPMTPSELATTPALHRLSTTDLFLELWFQRVAAFPRRPLFFLLSQRFLRALSEAEPPVLLLFSVNSSHSCQTPAKQFPLICYNLPMSAPESNMTHLARRMLSAKAEQFT